MDPFYMEADGIEFFVPVTSERGRVGYSDAGDGNFVIRVEAAARDAKSIATNLTTQLGWQTDGQLFTTAVNGQTNLGDALDAAYMALTRRNSAVTVNRWIPEDVAAAALVLVARGLRIPGASAYWSKRTLFERIDALI